MVYVVPLSGGCDSLCMAYTMLALFPNEKFIIVHADTGSEVKGTAEALEKFEAFTGQKIERIYPKYDLFTLIEKNGNFLPSQRARFCTQNLKTIPIKVFFNKLRAEHGEDAFFLQFVGLRADEPKRKGIDWNEGFIGSAYPFQSLGLVKSDINNIVSSTQGIPLYYINKSRSGCTSCPFQRRSEIIDSWEESPVALDRAAKMEEIPTTVLNEYNALPTKAHEIAGTSRNWMNYFRPSELGYSTAGFEGRRGKNKMNNKVVDLFGASEAKRLYVAVEYHYYANSFGLCAEAHVFFEKLITYSTSLGGLKIALKHFWLHRISTRELYSMSEEEMTGERQVYIFELEIDDFEKEIPKAPEGVFTWQSDRKPLYAIRKTVAVAERILLTEGERQNLNSSVKMIRESAEDAVPKLNKEKEYGRILNVQKYDKPSLEDLVDDFDIEDAPAPCMSCAR
ncbi:MAG: hypothetical protein HAW67_03900 [Endozoicomonadaceae bacterium]|nr:hypothetical protein [Endozoicomonadaceae bacterium]